MLDKKMKTQWEN